MQTIIKPSAAIRQNYTEIANLCKETGEPVFLTKNGEGDLVVMDIAVYDQRIKQLELREKLVEIEELRKMGITLSYNGKLFERIAEESLSLDTGARELSNTVNYIFENIMYDVFANPHKYRKCILHLDIVNDNTKYNLS